MSKELKMKKTKIEVGGEPPQSFVILNFVDEDGNKYHMKLEVKHMFNDEYNAYANQLFIRAQEAKMKRENINVFT